MKEQKDLETVFAARLTIAWVKLRETNLQKTDIENLIAAFATELAHGEIARRDLAARLDAANQRLNSLKPDAFWPPQEVLPR